MIQIKSNTRARLMKFALYLTIYLFIMGVCFAAGKLVANSLVQSDIINCKKELAYSKDYSANYFITKTEWEICNSYNIEINPKFILTK